MHLDRLRRALQRHEPVDDQAFDEVYDAEYRRVSAVYWTPVETARRAARMLVDEGARRILDVGSGVGKFCIVGAACSPEARFIGVEQRAHLVRAAHDALCRLSTTRVQIIHSRVETLQLSEVRVDGYYLYNPFAENLYDADGWLDDTVHLSAARFDSDVAHATAMLERAAPGTPVVTYYGLGARLPAPYVRVQTEQQRKGGSLELWIKDGDRRS